MIQITKLKKIFHNHGVQLSIKALNMIKDDINRQFEKMAINCKDGNVKRLTPETYHIALGKWSKYLEK